MKLTEKTIGQILRKYPETFKWMYEDDPKILLFALKIHGYYIKNIKNPSLEMQKIAINNDSSSISHIKNPDESIQLEVVQKDARNFVRINNPSDKVIKIALKKDFFNYKYLKKSSIEIDEEFCRLIAQYKTKNDGDWHLESLITSVLRRSKVSSNVLLCLESKTISNVTKEAIKKHKCYKNLAKLVLSKIDQK